MAAALPAPVSYDPAAGVLVVEAAPDAQDLRDRHAGGRFSREVAAQAGRALALLHGTPPAMPGDEGTPAPASWSLQLHRPGLKTAQRVLTGAARELVCRMQRLEDLCAALDELNATRPDDAVIHGDIRWDNILTARAPGGTSPRRPFSQRGSGEGAAQESL